MGPLGLCYLSPTSPRVWSPARKASSGNSMAKQPDCYEKMYVRKTSEQPCQGPAPALPGSRITQSPQLSSAAGVPTPAQVLQGSRPAHLTLDLPCHYGLVRLVCSCWLNVIAVTLLLLFGNCWTAPPTGRVTAPACSPWAPSLPSLIELPTPAAPRDTSKASLARNLHPLFHRKALGLECVPGSSAQPTYYGSPVFQSSSAGHPKEPCLTVSKRQTSNTSDQSEQHIENTALFQTFISQIKAREPTSLGAADSNQLLVHRKK